MLKNYVFIAFRNLYRNGVYSFINVAGLSVGLASAILILLWVSDELSYNTFHQNYDNIYRVNITQDFSGSIQTSNTTPFPLAEAIRAKSGKVKHATFITYQEGFLLAADETKFYRMAHAVTEDFLKMFSFEMIRGNAGLALSDPYSIVLTESTAKGLFGDEDPMNKVVSIDNEHELKVTGILRDVPSQSSLQFDFLLPMSFMETTEEWVRDTRENWNNNSFQTYIELQPGASAEEVTIAIGDLIKANDMRSPTAELLLHPMNKWRLYTEFTNGKASGGMIEYVQLFSIIGLFILVIACINFMNLATARSQNRAREVGTRKSVGSGRRQLIFQFLGESIFITTTAFVLAIVIVEIVLPFYNILVGKNLVINYTNPLLWIAAIAMVIITGIIAGSYPAFYLSAFKPVKVLKGKLQNERGAVTPRKILVTAQFAFSIFLIIGTMVIYQQIVHVKSRHIGYNREDLLLIWTTNNIEKNFQPLRDALKQSGLIKAVCKSSAPISRVFSSSDNVTWPGKMGNEKVSFTTMATEYDFTETMGITMLEGRDFSRDFKSDTSAIIINKAALELMGLQNPIGQKITLWGSDRTIIGVIDNVIMESPYHPVEPLALVFIPGWSSTISVRLESTDDLTTTLKNVEAIVKRFDPDHPLAYRFADTEFETKFTTINLVGRLAWIFSFLAIFIASLGLFGLAAFTTEQRTKEVGIRKVLGASVSSLVVLISKDFSKLVIVAFIIASPITWWLLNQFLEQYPYRISISWWVLPLAGLSVLILAIAIVGTQAMRAASTNPVHSLRSE